MKLLYKNKKIEKLCTDSNAAKKLFGNDQKTVINFLATLNFIESSESLFSVVMYKKFKFHSLQGKLKDCYAIDIVNRKSPWRLIVQVLDDDEKIVSNIDDLYLIAKNIKIMKAQGGKQTL